MDRTRTDESDRRRGSEFIKAARTDDTGRFALLTECFRRELLAHCYRMLASYEDA